MNHSIIGAGAMGRAVARRLALAGETVLLADRDHGAAWRVAAEVSDGAAGLVVPADVATALVADLIVLALPHRESLLLAAVEHRRLAGKVVVDVANPADGSGAGAGGPGGARTPMAAGMPAVMGAPMATVAPLATRTPTAVSAAELLAAAIPEASVVKAFNTTGASVLYAGELDGVLLDVFVASDDEDAKLAVIELVNRAGLRGFDMGRLANARGLEQLASLSDELQDRLGLNHCAGFKFLPCW
ncbi:NADPH-dependent F420 reductase [Streptomyces sp. H27-D2]|uniref:NADPH-dependent F420 reductase n=1 Tax=Streptomyces sp. H27-D2 TaxID=3046304 RepID=UPI002DBF6CB7|nr:NAD(P)-binding domain-containing protein [Streptomyces sp. H27-D2]MEC4019418.1 NAD(P)-binding domain-containing protein [Streptomyces sp. H27-D2]